MRRLIVSDIHGNLDALQAVSEDARGRYDSVWCLGDIVGYGACPAEAIAWVRENASVAVRGNHDQAYADDHELEDFSKLAELAIRWTRTALSTADAAWLGTLQAGPVLRDDCQLVHGSPEDQDEYLVHTSDVLHLSDVLLRKLCFFGHTHLQGGWCWVHGGVMKLPAVAKKETERVVELDPDGLYLLNPGSVGQPRDGDPRAAYLIWDTDQRTIQFRRVRYDVAAAAERIRAAGLPSPLGDRLFAGR